MNFFKQLQETGIRDISLAIATDDTGHLTVIITPKSTAKDAAFKTLQPFWVTGTPSELDAGFFDEISTTLGKARQMFSNVEQYEAQLAETERATALQKEQQGKIKDAVDSLKKIIEAEDYEPLRDKKKVLKAIDIILDIDPENLAAEKARAELLEKTSQGSIFDESLNT